MRRRKAASLCSILLFDHMAATDPYSAGGKYDIDVFQSKVIAQEYIESIGLPALFVQPGVRLEFPSPSALLIWFSRSGTSTTCSNTRRSISSPTDRFLSPGSERSEFSIIIRRRSLTSSLPGSKTRLLR